MAGKNSENSQVRYTSISYLQRSQTLELSPYGNSTCTVPVSIIPIYGNITIGNPSPGYHLWKHYQTMYGYVNIIL